MSILCFRKWGIQLPLGMQFFYSHGNGLNHSRPESLKSNSRSALLQKQETDCIMFRWSLPWMCSTLPPAAPPRGLCALNPQWAEGIFLQNAATIQTGWSAGWQGGWGVKEEQCAQDLRDLIGRLKPCRCLLLLLFPNMISVTAVGPKESSAIWKIIGDHAVFPFILFYVGLPCLKCKATKGDLWSLRKSTCCFYWVFKWAPKCLFSAVYFLHWGKCMNIEANVMH